VTLTDQVGLNKSSLFFCTVIIVANFTKNIELLASNNDSYSLPMVTGDPNEHVFHPTPLPRYADFNFPNYTFYP